MKLFIISFLITYCSLLPEHYEADKIEVLSIYDGDTIKVMIEVYPDLFKKISIRLDGIDTPESTWRAKCDKELADSVKAKQWLVDAMQDKEITIDTVHPGKFAKRMLGTVYANGINLSEAALEAGHARPYFGKKRSDWCK